MPSDDRYGLGYRRVDDVPDVDFHVATMEDTDRWDSIRTLRGWERSRLGLRPGQRLLDVGCGLGTAALDLATDAGPSGEVVGIDASEAMLAVARARAAGASSRVRFSIGDAGALDEPDGRFDAARCERTLQWLADPQVAVDELARVLRPGGRLGLIDTDWSTLHLDVGDDAVTAAVREGMRHERNRPSNVGGRLGELARAANLDAVAETTVTHEWSSWDPDASPAPDGCFSMASLADDLVDAGQLDAADADRFTATIVEAARQRRFAMTLTMHAVVATAPA